MATTLFELTAEMAAIEDALFENGGELTEELQSAFEENRESLISKVDGYNAIIGKCDMHINYLAEEIKRRQGLKKTYENMKNRLKDHVLDTMARFGIQRLEGMDCKMSRRTNAPVLVVDNEEALTSKASFDLEALKKQYPYLTFSVGIDKVYLKNMYKESGILMDGCHMAQSESLIIK